MLRISSPKPGASPGTLVHVGERKVERTRIEILRYAPDVFESKVTDTIEEAAEIAKKGGVSWINVDGLHDTAMIERIGKEFRLHALLLEDVLNTQQRPKFEDYGEYRFIVLKMLNLLGEIIEPEQLSLVLLPNAVLTFQERPGDSFDTVRDRIRNGKGRIRTMGADYLAYAILDRVVDDYFVIGDRVGEEIETLEQDLVQRPEPESLKKIHRVRRVLILLRKSIWPVREIVGNFLKGDPLIHGDSLPYYRDLHDHAFQVIDLIEAFRDVTGGLLDLYLSMISFRTNEIMKVLTIIATIFIPLTFIAGVYGMNFDYMPELRSPWGYPAIWAVMIAIGGGMLGWFKKRGWF